MTFLPVELLLLIVHNATVQTLTSLTLCSRQIRLVVFPLLYRRVIFNEDYYDDLSQFSLRVISEANGENLVDELRIADHVHHLEFSRCRRCAGFKEDELELLTQALQHLKALRGLTWSALLPKDHTIFAIVQTTCKGIQDIRLQLQEYFNGDEDEYLEALFGFRGLKRLEISMNFMPGDKRKLPRSMVDMIRASPDLMTLDLSLDTFGVQWDIDTLFQSVDIAPTTLRLRQQAELDLHAFSDSMKPTPFRAFLLSHPERITSLALPAPLEEEDFTYADGPPSLNLLPDMLPALREFEGTLYWCSQLSKLQVASSLRSLTVLFDGPGNEKWEMFLEGLKAFSSLKALNMFNAENQFPAKDLKVIVDNAPHLESLTFALLEDESAHIVGSQLSSLGLRTLATRIYRPSFITPEQYARTLAEYCTSLVTVEDLRQSSFGIFWVATIRRKEGGIDLEVAQTGPCMGRL